MDEWDILVAMGWCVVEADRMVDHGCLVRGQKLAIARAGLTPAEREAVGVVLLSRALSRDGLPRPARPVP